MNEVRVRIAPSPSGNLHIGTARTALFNYLFAKKNNGKFVLRIEDTDADRTSQAYIDNIFDSLKALGLNWDEGPDVGGPYGPYTQSERFDIYPKYVQELLDKGFAYECFCTPEELEAEKAEATKNKKPYVYTKKCEHLTEEEKEKLRAEGRKPAIRFNIAKAQKTFHDSSILKFDDLVKGELHMDTSLLGDFVIMKSNGAPTYNFAVVIDDMLMKISHVIRGEDHISNTFKQILIFELKSTTKAHNAGSKEEGMIAQVKRYAQDFYKNPTKTLNWDVNTDVVQYTGIILARKSDIDKELTSNNVSGGYHQIPFLEDSYYYDDEFSKDNSPKKKMPIRIELYSFEDIYNLASDRNGVFFKLLKREFEFNEDDD